MRKHICVLLVLVCTLIGFSIANLRDGISPYYGNDGIDEAKGTSPASATARGVFTFEDLKDINSDIIMPQWIERLVLVAPGNYPFTTFLTEKYLAGVRGRFETMITNDTAFDGLDWKDKKGRFNGGIYTDKKYWTDYERFSNGNMNTANNNIELNWGEIGVLPYQATVTVANAGGASLITLTVSNAVFWKRGSGVYFQSLADTNGDGGTLNGRVTAVDTVASTITVENVSQVNFPSIPLDSKITRTGDTYGELAVKATPVTPVPYNFSNFGQNYITSVVFSKWEQATELFVNYSFAQMQTLALQDFRNTQELTMCLGRKASFVTQEVDPVGGSQMYTTGGLTYFIDQEITLGLTGQIFEDDLVDLMAEMRVGNNGAPTRFLFCGFELVAALNKGVLNDSTRFVKQEFDTVYGLSFTCLYCFFGRINVAYSPLLDQTDYTDKGFLLDMDYINKFVFMPFKLNSTDLEKIRESRADAADFIETSGLVVQNIGAQFTVILG